MKPESLEEQMKILLSQGQKIQAIALLREATGIGLAEAKRAVEELEVTGSLPIGTVNSPSYDRDEQRGTPQKERHTASADERELLALLENGKKVQAIKLYRQKTGVELREAKEAVERLAEKHGVILPGVAVSAGLLLFIALWILAGGIVFVYFLVR